MKQVLRKGLKHIVVDEVPDPAPTPHHVLVRPMYSLISAGTETASAPRDVEYASANAPSAAATQPTAVHHARVEITRVMDGIGSR